MKAGANRDALKSDVLLDSEKKATVNKQIQKNIIKAIRRKAMNSGLLGWIMMTV